MVPVDRMLRDVAYVWTMFQYPPLPAGSGLAPDLLTDTEHTRAEALEWSRTSLVEAYQISAALLVKLGDAELTGLAVDPPMLAATGQPRSGSHRSHAARAGVAHAQPRSTDAVRVDRC